MTGELIVFDLGSTLVDGPEKGPAGRVVAALGLPRAAKGRLHEALMTRPFERPGEVADLLRREYGATGDQVDREVADVWAAQEDDAVPVPGALEALAGLADGGYRFALASNIWHPYLVSARKHLGHFFDSHIPSGHQFFSYRAGCAKPSPRLLEQVLRATGVPAGSAVMVGDSHTNDVAPALALGMRAVWVLREPHREVPALVGAVNGTAPRPSLAIASIAGLTDQAIAAAFAAAPDVADHNPNPEKSS
ncbi:HAD family hydrolase [Actinokineospora spheciospongiae]|uniref:HAD family hydrolase n=1 Tax=Actinokineospora spheciospongiae TaxID=909613 RepID=UPI000D7144C0|nr:HAD family hydrolase [Actinokineospora spheciospongiae]PWW62789.1 HAD superfamily hydrolase (TIGR01509 family) [Actinokineospora spheciospongiae]